MSGAMIILVYVAVIVFVIALVKGAKKNGKKPGNQIRMMQERQKLKEERMRDSVTRRAEHYVNRAERAYDHYERTVGAGKNRLGLEDDENDWLACQMREEQRAYREMSEMFEVKLSHMKNCAAENLRLDHALHCDAGQVAEESRSSGSTDL